MKKLEAKLDSTLKDNKTLEILLHQARVNEETYKLMYEWEKEKYDKIKPKFDKYAGIVWKYDLENYPAIPLKDIELKMKLIDPYVAETLVNYLVIDWYELVKNISQTVNKDNASEVIAFRDGAIGRNNALIKKLQSIKKVSYLDKMTGEVKEKNS